MNSGRSNAVVNISNILTLSRLRMTPLFVILLLWEHLTLAENEASEPQHFS